MQKAIKLPANIRIGKTLIRPHAVLYGVLAGGVIPMSPRFQRHLYKPGRGKFGRFRVYQMFYTPTVAGFPQGYADDFVRGWKD